MAIHRGLKIESEMEDENALDWLVLDFEEKWLRYSDYEYES